ncbi:MAG: hypothetical protein JO260_00120, partial [Acidobacteria bacterium]|nr:hypothetical protein [Acidobacteriota bacterium]
MPRVLSRPTLYLLAISILFVFVGATSLRTRPTHAAATRPRPSPDAFADAGLPSDSTDALRFNTLGVPHMNKKKIADAQKYFEK